MRTELETVRQDLARARQQLDEAVASAAEREVVREETAAQARVQLEAELQQFRELLADKEKEMAQVP